MLIIETVPRKGTIGIAVEVRLRECIMVENRIFPRPLGFMSKQVITWIYRAPVQDQPDSIQRAALAGVSKFTGSWITGTTSPSNWYQQGEFWGA